VDQVQESRHHCHWSAPQQRKVCPAFQLQVLPAFSPHVPHWQLEVQTCWPQQTVETSVEHMQSAMAPTAQTPSPEQEVNAPH